MSSIVAVFSWSERTQQENSLDSLDMAVEYFKQDAMSSKEKCLTGRTSQKSHEKY
jgi:hypothetical protein